MITLLIILSLYSATLSTFLFGRWVRLIMLRRRVRKQIRLENLSPEKREFLTEHPPIYTKEIIKLMKDEMEGVVVGGYEVEMEREESEEIEESVEEREYQIEQDTIRRRSQR